MSSELIIEAHGLSKAYTIFKRPKDRLKQMLWRGRKRYFEEFWALNGVDLEVRRGETIGVIGRNGSGKSTLLQLICGTLTPTRGDLAVNGRIAALLELGAGFNPEFTGRENVYLAASVLGLSTRQITERMNAILSFAAIGDFIDQPVKLYSSGMYTRLAFAVAAHADADTLIVDEILAVGDSAFVQKCMRFIHKFRERGTLLFCSHDMASVTKLCDRAIWLDKGVMVDEGPAKEVCHNYLAAVYGQEEDADAFQIGGKRKTRPKRKPRLVRDPRAELLKQSALRNEIELFDFDPDAPWFGNRGATITNVALLDPDGRRIDTLEGGEEVIIKISCKAHKAIIQPVLGFYLKDRLGQNLFGDNTYLAYQHADFQVRPEQEFSAAFNFQMPFLPSGDFSITAAVAEGAQDGHIQHHFIDDALFLKVNSTHVVGGLIGVPMLSIEMAADHHHNPRPTADEPRFLVSGANE